MSIKYGEKFNFLKFYGNHTIKQSLIDKNLIGPANIDEYFALFLQGYIDDYDGEGAIFGEKSIDEVLAETKKKIDHYDQYNIEQSMAGLFNAPPLPPYGVYKIRTELKSRPLHSETNSATTGENDIEGLGVAINAIWYLNDDDTDPIYLKINSLITEFNETIRIHLKDPQYNSTKFVGGNIGVLLQKHLTKWKNLLINDYYYKSIQLFIGIHKDFYRFSFNYCDDGKNIWWVSHPNWKDWLTVESYISYVESLDSGYKPPAFLDINTKLKQTRLNNPINRTYKIEKESIEGINAKVEFYLDLRDQVDKMINIYNKLFQSNLVIGDNIEDGARNIISNDTIEIMCIRDFIINNLYFMFFHPLSEKDTMEYMRKFELLSTYVIFKIYRYLLTGLGMFDTSYFFGRPQYKGKDLEKVRNKYDVLIKGVQGTLYQVLDIANNTNDPHHVKLYDFLNENQSGSSNS